ELPASVQEFAGRWFELPRHDWFQMGTSRSIGSLGRDVVLGTRIWLAHLCFRVRMGPMSFRDYCRFLPLERAFQRLKSWILNYCGAELLWDLQLVLRAAEVPNIQLGRAGKLGWTTWLKTKPFQEDADDLILEGAV